MIKNDVLEFDMCKIRAFSIDLQVEALLNNKTLYVHVIGKTISMLKTCIRPSK